MLYFEVMSPELYAAYFKYSKVSPVPDASVCQPSLFALNIENYVARFRSTAGKQEVDITEDNIAKISKATNEVFYDMLLCEIRRDQFMKKKTLEVGMDNRSLLHPRNLSIIPALRR